MLLGGIYRLVVVGEEEEVGGSVGRKVPTPLPPPGLCQVVIDGFGFFIMDATNQSPRRQYL